MTPDLWNELKMSTQGSFEGIGIRITTDYRQPCNGDLTVVEVFDGAPAQKAGLQVGDKIIRIEKDSTVNITTGEAADQLRGTPGTSVNVTIRRKNGSIKHLSIVRQRIPIKSVTSKMMKDKIGYIHLEGFQQSSAAEMREALDKMHEQGMKGLMLDLRSNPGGLLTSAIEIADMFISGGSIVTTAGRNKDDRDVSNATSENTEPVYPMVVLIDAYSASAAEILSGALKNHGRALLVGDTSFGKGSVQNIIPLPDGGAMRMTIQQYLIPGDMSIQAVGVSPDVYFRPRIVDAGELLISNREREFSEAALDAHLTRASSIERADREGALQMPYFVSSRQRKLDLEMYKKCYAENPEIKPYRNRYEVDFARELLALATGSPSSLIMQTARQLVQSRSNKEYSKLSGALKKIGIDWSFPKGEAAGADEMISSAKLSASVTVSGKVEAGKKIFINVTVKNNSSKTVHRLRAKTESDNPYLSDIEMVFGKVDPGKSAYWKAEILFPPVAPSRIDPVKISFFSFEGIVPRPVSIDVDVKGRVRPELAYDWWLDDLGNGNGFMEPGEEFRMHIRVKNEGKGSTFKMAVNLSALGIDVESGHFVMKALKTGQTGSGEFVLKIPEKISRDKVDVSLSFEEWVPLKIPSLIPLQQQKLEMKIEKSVAQASSASGTITLSGDNAVNVYNAPDLKSRLIATGASGESFKVVKRSGAFFLIEQKGGRRGWILADSTLPGGNAKGKLTAHWDRLPSISIDSDPSVQIKTSTFEVKGTVSHPLGIRDVFVFVSGKKVIYHPLVKGTSEYKFSFSVPVEEGANKVSVVARHDEKIVASKTVFVRRQD
jgi:carboxyl-terminal processing protease